MKKTSCEHVESIVYYIPKQIYNDFPASCEHVESIANSQTNLQRFPSFKSFANVAMHAFSSGKSAAKVTQYAVRLDDYTKTRANIFTWWLS